VKRLWAWIVAVEVALLAAYAAWDAGNSIPLLASRVTWLALVFAAFDLSIAASINGVRAFRTSTTTSPWLSVLAGFAVFLVACALLALFVVFGIPRN
jgi:hypothetical protein